ncbi:MAG: GNAT family N-acetyltransferase [Clostridia bacterium]|nr:GNAT family N-acetyltransferase [Clostridia bacterium]
MRIVCAQDRIADCIDIRRRVFVIEQGVPWELEVDGMDEPESGCTHFLMLDDSGKPIGTFRAYFESADTVHLQRFCILKEFRGLGFGREALRFVEEHYKEKGAARITFGAQCSAIPFYEKCGYTCVSDVFPDAGIPHRTMEKGL